MSDTEKSRVSRAWRVLALTSSSTFLVSLDTSIVVVARKAMIDDLGHPTLMTWVFSAYSIAYAAGLLTAGRFADVFGRKASFLRGLTLFSIGSLLCGIAPPSAWMTRAMTSTMADGAMPHSSDPMLNRVSPRRNEAFRPKTSANRPAVSSPAA